MRTLSALTLALLGATAAAEGPGRPVDIFFTSRTTVVNKAEVQAANKARHAEAARKAKELEQAYKAEYGKDERKWPRAKQFEVRRLRAEASEGAGEKIELDYASASPKELADSARDLAKGAGPYGKRLLRAVESADQADLVVEVTGRHSSKSDGIFADQFGFILRLSAGGKLAPGRLRSAATAWPTEEEMDDEVKVAVNELQAYSEDEPYWRLQVQGGVRWVNLASLTNEVLADFVRMNGSMFSGK